MISGGLFLVGSIPFLSRCNDERSVFLPGLGYRLKQSLKRRHLAITDKLLDLNLPSSLRESANLFLRVKLFELRHAHPPLKTANFLTVVNSLVIYITSSNPFGVEVILKMLGDAGLNFDMTPFQMLGISRFPGIIGLSSRQTTNSGKYEQLSAT